MESTAGLKAIEEDDAKCYVRYGKDQLPIYAENIDYKMAVGLGFKYETDAVYGVPERKAHL